MKRAAALTALTVSLLLGQNAKSQEQWKKDLVKWCDPKTVQNVSMMLMVGGSNGPGSKAYYRYMEKILDGIYINNLDKAKTEKQQKELYDFIVGSKRYILKNCPG